MAIVIEDYVIRFEISVDNVSLVKVLESKENFSDVESGSVLAESSLVYNDFSKIATGTEVENEEQFGHCLECEVEVDNEGMSHVGEDVSFCLGVSDKVLTKDLSLTESFHGVEFARVFVSHEVHITKTSTSKLLKRQKVVLAISASRVSCLNSVNLLDIWRSIW